MVRTWLDAGLLAEVLTVSDDQPPKVGLTPDGIAGIVDGAEDLLAGELAAALATEKMQSTIEKVGALGHEERHLFLWVRMSAFTVAVTDNIYFGSLLPAAPPQLPGGLSQVWLSGGSVGGTVRAISGVREVREPPTAPPTRPRRGVADLLRDAVGHDQDLTGEFPS